MGMNTQNQQSQPNGPDRSRDDAWLARPSTIRLLWWVFGVVLALSVAAQLIIKVKGYYGVDDWPGFAAVYGFVACLAMVLVAKVLGWLLKRPEDYYRERQDD
jgi:sterol desaturase/sphingolipid hydroxylase (fatty acid hydroxylase superfamily)